jgi:23S rRNA pseudouridine1911/1915/1917 synthase
MRPNYTLVVKKTSYRLFSFSISVGEGEERLDTFLTSHIEGVTRSKVQNLVKKGFAKVNGRDAKAGYRLKEGDDVNLSIPPDPPNELKPEPIEFAILHEDSSLIVLNKPSGLVVHPAPGHPTGTLVHGLLQYCPELSGRGGLDRPGIIHRLDKDTSGLMVVAKNDSVHRFLSGQFEGGSVKKRYLALVHGNTKGVKGEINLPIARHPKRRKEMSVSLSGGKKALTFWKKLETFDDKFSFLSVSPKTGRTHQIRVHLTHLGHPIVGDQVYGHKKNWWKKHAFLKNHPFPPIERQMLHAETLGFIHPDSEVYCEFQAHMPEDMEQLLRTLRSIHL